MKRNLFAYKFFFFGENEIFNLNKVMWGDNKLSYFFMVYYRQCICRRIISSSYIYWYRHIYYIMCFKFKYTVNSHNIHISNLGINSPNHSFCCSFVPNLLRRVFINFFNLYAWIRSKDRCWNFRCYLFQIFVKLLIDIHITIINSVIQ